ncbi:reverse transcriptase domain-containing protein [Myroides odoratimimus]|uniref:reverse transcriptase domain-containing protein n=1 Tax=Myroides odoratimimus TaxID=76832 RepID=UPI0031011B0E
MKDNNLTLLDKISDIDFLNTAWKKLDKSNKDSHGLSGETISSFDKNKDDKISSISNRLKKGQYFFSRTRGVLISKKGKNTFRPLQIPEVQDRVVIKAIALVLEEIFEPTLNKSNGYSFAYQKNLGTKDALLKIKDYYEKGNEYILEADLVNFFGTVNKQELLKNKIFPHLPDQSINKLITNALNQEIGFAPDFDENKLKWFKGIDKGIPQGNALSPLLSNIYLSDFDQNIISDNYNLVRYADDFVIVAPSKEECINAYNKCVTYLQRLDLEIHPLEKNEKTRITNIKEDTVTFLSVTFDGIYLYPSQENFEKLQDKIWELTKGKIELNLFDFIYKLNNKFDGWISAFIYTDLSRYYEELDSTINRVLYIKLEKINWKLKESHLDKVPNNQRKQRTSPFCLSEVQRKWSGISNTKELVVKKLQNIQEQEQQEQQEQQQKYSISEEQPLVNKTNNKLFTLLKVIISVFKKTK